MQSKPEIVRASRKRSKENSVVGNVTNFVWIYMVFSG